MADTMKEKEKPTVTVEKNTKNKNPASHWEEQATILMGKYEIGTLLGEGGSAKVYLARNIKTGESVAIKAVSKEKLHEKQKLSRIKTEASAMRSLTHPNIVQLYEVISSDTEIYFVMEYAKGGDLYHQLQGVNKPLPDENTSRRYFQQLISALAFCHSRGIYHRDLKPENLLLDENGNLKVADFGLSTMEENVGADGLFHTRCGTPLYLAPEVIDGQGYDGAKADIWSCGIILYALRSGCVPFNGKLVIMCKKMYEKDYRCPSKFFSHEIKALLSRMLDPNPETRITIQEIMKDPWFKVGFNDNISSQPCNSDCRCSDDICHDDLVSDFKNLSTEPKPFNLMLSFDSLSEDLTETICKPVLRFTSKKPVSAIIGKFEEIGMARGFSVRKEECKVEMQGPNVAGKGRLAFEAEIFEVAPSLCGVDVRQKGGGTPDYEKFLEEYLRPGLQDIVWNWQDNIMEE